MDYRTELSESDVVWNCCVWLNSNGWYAWRNSSTGVYDKSAGTFRRPPPFTISGVSDIVAIRDGVTTFIECKFGSGRLSSDQLLFQKQCLKRGVSYVVVVSLEELKTWLSLKATG